MSWDVEMWVKVIFALASLALLGLWLATPDRNGPPR